MSTKLEELINLWGKSLGQGELAAADKARFNELMNDPVTVESFSQWQASVATAEQAQGLNDEQWARVDAKVKSGYHGFLKPWYAKPWIWGLAAVPVVCGISAVSLFNRATRADDSVITKVDDRPFEIREISHHRPATRHPRPQAPAMPSAIQKMAQLEPVAPIEEPHFVDPLKARKVSVVVERPSQGQVQVVVKDPRGNMVCTIYSGLLKAGKWKFEWNGLDESHAAVKPGRYHVEVRSEAGVQVKDIEITRK
jgi:hypothetical protein